MPEEFIDYYELMQISPNAEPQTVVRVFRMLAARYHPDNTQSGDLNIFMRLMEAYKVLTNAEQRADYDVRWQAQRAKPLGVFGRKEFTRGMDGEANRRLGILTLLYARRRANPDRPGCSVLEFEQSMATPREHLLFSLWYLKDKCLLAQNDSSDYVITHLGVDFVEEKLPSSDSLHRLLTSGEEGTLGGGDAPPWPVDPNLSNGDVDG